MPRAIRKYMFLDLLIKGGILMQAYSAIDMGKFRRELVTSSVCGGNVIG